MKTLTLAVTTGTLVLVLWAFTALGADARPRCEQCNMYWDISSTRVEAVLKVKGNKGTHQFESMGCLYNWMHAKERDGSTVVKLSVLDYTTAGSEKEKMLDGLAATYLYDTKPLSGSMQPFIAAFADERAAELAKKTLGGKLRDYTELMESLERAARKAEKNKPAA
jgi:nitrous oxide reductase accessory protein NosL